MHLLRLGSLPVYFNLTSGDSILTHFRLNLMVSSENLNRVLKNGIVESLLCLEQKVRTVNATLLNIYKSKWNAVA